LSLLYKSDKIGTIGTVLNYTLNFTISDEQLNEISLTKEKEVKKSSKSKRNKKNIAKKTPVVQATITAVEETTTTVEETVPVVEEITPVVEETAPVVEEQQPSSTNKIPPPSLPENTKERTIEVDLKKIINTELRGKYSLLLKCDYQEKDDFLKIKQKELNISNEIDKTDPNFNEEEHAKNTIKYMDYLKLFMPIDLEKYVTKNYTIYNKFLKLFNNDIFMEFVDFVLETRFKKMVGDRSFMFEELPEKIFNYNELKENPDLLDKMLDYDSNSDSDEEKEL
jgi:hypothetical protein